MLLSLEKNQTISEEQHPDRSQVELIITINIIIRNDDDLDDGDGVLAHPAVPSSFKLPKFDPYVLQPIPSHGNIMLNNFR